MNTVNMLLDLALYTIVILTTAFIIVGITSECVQLWHRTRTQLRERTIAPNATITAPDQERSLVNSTEPDPWLSPVTNTIVTEAIASLPKPKLRLLPPAKNVVNLNGIDIDRLPLVKCKKVAKVLGIAQTVNRQAVPVALLRKQIQTKLKTIDQQQLTIVQQMFAS